MTALQYVENLLRNNWESTIAGRPHSVGDIGDRVKIVYESDKDWRRMDLSNYDYITLTDGGISEITPTTFGWLNEDQTAHIDVDVRTRGWSDEGRPGRIALYGERGAGSLGPNEGPRHGGLVGEILRCARIPRKGDQEFSLVHAHEANDLSGQMGGGIWRGVVSMRLESRSLPINTVAGGGYGFSWGTAYGEQ